MPISIQQFTDANGNQVTLPVTRTSQIPYIEYVDEYTERFFPDEVESTRLVACRYSDRQQFIRDFIGYPSWNPGSVVGGVQTNMTRTIPEQHPDLGDLWCVGMELVEGVGVQPADTSNLAKALSSSVDFTKSSMRDAGSNMAAWNLMKYRATYRTQNYTIASDADVESFPAIGELARYVIKNYQFAAENMAVPGGGFLFVTDQTRLYEPPPRINATLNIVYQWMAVPLAGFDYVANFNALGHVNSVAFDNFYPAGTLLLGSMDIKRYRDALTIPVQDVTYNYLYRNNGGMTYGFSQGGSFIGPKGHNFIYKQSANDFIEVSTDGVARWSANPSLVIPADGVAIYNATDLSAAYKLLDGSAISTNQGGNGQITFWGWL